MTAGPRTRELVEYGDFECPYCKGAEGALRKLRARMGDALTFEWRHFPIVERHPHAERAAEAAEAARAQGSFEEMHDLLFANQRALADEDLRRYAGELGLDTDRFDAELRDGTHLETIRAQRDEGVARGVQGTPAFFIDGERYGGFYDLESLLDALA